MGASEDGARAFARAGLKVLELGDEAIIEVERFGLEGREMRPVRQAVRRVERAGYTARIRRHAEVPPDEMADAVRLADAWRDTAAERGFSMALSRLGDPADGRCVLVEALDRDGRVGALLSFTPWGRHGLSLDLMRRDRNGDNGIVEFMVAALVEAAPKLDVHRVSLNSRCSARRSRRAPASAPGRFCGPGGGCCWCSRTGGNWSRCTGPTRSTGRGGCRGSSASANVVNWRRSAWRARWPRAS
jgi:lysylphosphatidylglycerol synthetase-like protein (DUF2156 family)